MFEKEAEEYIKEHTFFDEEFGVQSLDVVNKTIFKDGAEFGYNKAKKDADKMKSRFLELCNLKDMRIAELEAQIEKMKCCGNCKHCKYDQNEESNEYCEKHQQIVNIVVQACGYWEFDNWGK